VVADPVEILCGKSPFIQSDFHIFNSDPLIFKTHTELSEAIKYLRIDTIYLIHVG
jgi:hypothetical protein